MNRQQRLLRSRDFERVLRQGRSVGSTYLALFISDNKVGRPRVGLAVSRRLGNAVERNRIKRRLRELARPLVVATQVGRDVVIVPRPRALTAQAARLRQEMESLWLRGLG